MTKHKWRELTFALAFLVLTALLLHLAAAVLRPAHTDYGSTWAGYLAEPKDSIDVLYLGSSYAYCDTNPAKIYESAGLTGYVLAGSEQTLAITYYYLQEALRTQSPQAVVLEASALFFETYQNYTQINIGYMPWSLSRVGAIFAAAKPEDRLGLVWDLSVYHSRWKDVCLADWKRVFTPATTDDLKGYTMVDKVFDGVQGGPFLRESPISQALYQENLAWLEKILALCQAHGIQALVTVNPTYSQYFPDVYEAVAADVARLAPSARFCNWSNAFAELGLDPARHLYDGGHLNRGGADLFSAWLGRFLRDEVGLTPREQSPENQAAWERAVAFWNQG